MKCCSVGIECATPERGMAESNSEATSSATTSSPSTSPPSSSSDEMSTKKVRLVARRKLQLLLKMFHEMDSVGACGRLLPKSDVAKLVQNWHKTERILLSLKACQQEASGVHHHYRAKPC